MLVSHICTGFVSQSHYVSLNFNFQGNYGRLSRILFYCTIVFCLLSSSFEWLIAGALAAALTYSGTAAAHACMLIWIGPSYGELDFYALCAILSTSCLITVPLVNWSSTLRNLGSHAGGKPGTRMIIIYWAFGVTLGFNMCIWKISSGCVPFNRATVSSVFCVPPGSAINYDAGQGLSLPTRFPRFLVDAEWINENGCMDPCAYGSFARPAAIFRSLSDLQMQSRDEIVNTFRVVYDVGFCSLYFRIGAAMGCFVLHQGIWAMCFGRRSPRQCRMVVYKSVRNARILVFRSRHGHGTASRGNGRLQRRSAKYLAIIAYLWAVFSTVLCVILFVFNVVAMEVLLSKFPQSESAKHGGAWSPWATTELIVAAAFISKVPDDMAQKIPSFALRALKRSGVWFRCMFVRVKQTMLWHRSSRQRRPAPTEAKILGSVGVAKSDRKSALFIIFKGKLASYRNTVADEWTSLVDFWRDPDCAERTIA